ncbi:MAG: phosphoenolpyruvate--protein phosphotransferase [Planctomycetes bacterium]|nr:phosphoenolpyruvate--protein phosphotransferase [Planctomycetota bacterium]
MSDTQSGPVPLENAPGHSAGGLVLRGTSVSPGLALGPIHRKDHDLDSASLERIPREAVERELNRFHKALGDARAQLMDLKDKLAGKVPAEDARILDVHVAYLKDSVFHSDVENLILGEQLCLEAAIAKVIADFDRIFKLVQNESLRERAVDLRDVGIRVLRHLERRSGEGESVLPKPKDYVLAAKELSIVDMFNLQGDHVLGILTEAGALTSHAAILARSMRIPTITAVAGLLENVREGDFAIVDASEGMARINPDEVVRAQYGEVRAEAPVAEIDGFSARDARIADGTQVRLLASCGNLPEVQAARAQGVDAIGVYRTELLFLVDKEAPSDETLAQHYASVVSAAGGAPVTFRLLHADSRMGLPFLHEAREANPALGRVGVRALLSRELVLRRQLAAILRAGAGGPVRVALPFVTDCGELRRVKEVVFEEKLELRKRGVAMSEKLQIGVIVEVAAALFGVQDLARESDFVLANLDALTQHLLGVDRDNSELRAWFEALHPCVLRGVKSLVDACEGLQRPFGVFGVTAVRRHNLPFLVGAGVREWSVEPSELREVARALDRIPLRQAQTAANALLSSSCQAETLSLVEGWKHGYARS